jgi:hypothetical protein
VRHRYASAFTVLAVAFGALWWLMPMDATSFAQTTAPAPASAAASGNVAAASPARRLPPPAVPQPIDFPHWRHAGPAAEGGMEMNCLYCHTYARRSTVAGIPPLAKCMGCHKHIATDKAQIKQLTGYWTRGEPVPWKKVHDLPEFVYFSHERHVQRFVFEQAQPVQQVCGYCHGDVKAMGVAERQKKLTMGWCLSCHKQFQDEPRDKPLPAAEWLVAPSDAPLVATGAGKPAHRANAPRDCWQCHK